MGIFAIPYGERIVMGHGPQPGAETRTAAATVAAPAAVRARHATATNGRGRTNGNQPQSDNHFEAQEILEALQAMHAGDFSVRLPRGQIGVAGKIADTFNEIVAANQRIAQQLEEVGEAVGREGKTRKRVRLGVSTGAWADMEESVNSLIDDLLWPTTA